MARTKKEVCRAIAEGSRIAQTDVIATVQRFLDQVMDEVVTAGRIELRNFGVLEVRERAARKRRNPRTGDPVMAPPTRCITFKPGRNFLARVTGDLLADGAGASHPEPPGGPGTGDDPAP